MNWREPDHPLRQHRQPSGPRRFAGWRGQEVKLKNNTGALSPQDFSEISGPGLLRKAFYPRQRLTITELSQVIGLSRDRIYKRIRAGKFNLRVQKNECGIPFASLEDVIKYLYPDHVPSSPSLSPAMSPDKPESKPRRGPGRPRKSSVLTGGAK